MPDSESNHRGTVNGKESFQFSRDQTQRRHPRSVIGMNATERFTKANDQLISLGLPPRLVLLYGRIAYHAANSGRCFAKLQTLAQEIGLKSEHSDRQVRNLLDQLHQLRLIEWTRGRYSNTYRVLDPDRNWISAQIGNGFPFSDRKRTSDRKESSSKEVLKEPLPIPPPGKGASYPKPSRKPAEETQKKKTDSDDDEKPNQRSQLTEAEFRHELKKRHGVIFDADRCLVNIKRQLEKCSGLSLTDFLQYDAEQTIAPWAIHNPHGYYTQLAKQLRFDTVAAALSSAFDPLQSVAAAVPEPERGQHGRCAACRGPGKFPDGKFCSCALGRDLERQERRQTTKNGLATGPRESKRQPAL
jgi:hypothetical protein